MVKCQRCKNRCKQGRIIRQKSVCGDCFALLNADNKARHSKGQPIPKNLKLLIINDVDYNFGAGIRRKRWKKSRLMLL